MRTLARTLALAAGLALAGLSSTACAAVPGELDPLCIAACAAAAACNWPLDDCEAECDRRDGPRRVLFAAAVADHGLDAGCDLDGFRAAMRGGPAAEHLCDFVCGTAAVCGAALPGCGLLCGRDASEYTPAVDCLDEHLARGVCDVPAGAKCLDEIAAGGVDVIELPIAERPAALALPPPSPPEPAAAALDCPGACAAVARCFGGAATPEPACTAECEDLPPDRRAVVVDAAAAAEAAGCSIAEYLRRVR